MNPDDLDSTMREESFSESSSSDSSTDEIPPEQTSMDDRPEIPGLEDSVVNIPMDTDLNLPIEPEPGTSVGEETTDSNGNTVYRFFNPTVGVHFYTADENERAVVESDNIYDFEGPSYNTLDPLTGNSVYRFFNSETGVHLYTTDENERDFIQENLDVFTFEGTAFNAYETQVEGSIPIYRFFRGDIGVHFYTPSESERDFVEDELDAYESEGIAYYALSLDSEIL